MTPRTLVVLAVAVLALPGGPAAEEPHPSPAARPEGYAGDEACADCHEEEAAALAHRELPESPLGGGFVCETCHGPSAGHARTHGKAPVGRQDERGGCHAEKKGPFLFEHGSARVTGCAACHTLHGSASRHLLTHQRVAELCFSCHSQAPGFHNRFDLDTRCTNCHASIHGSDVSEFFLD
jgi:predicted CXXCH cytochrome family protein